MASKGKQQEEISVIEITEGRMEFCVLGRSPLILNTMSEKTRHELLLPRGRKTLAERASTLKHNPPEEYRASAYKALGDDGPTRLLLPSPCFKKAMTSAALDIPGAQKSQIGRLTYVEGYYVQLYGVPKLFMAGVRSADMNRTPDIRTRALLPEWACRVVVTFMKPILREVPVANLLAAAGKMRGVGDWRPEKGSGDFGRFALVDANDKKFLSIIKNGGREVQDEALQNPEPFDAETADLLTWWQEESTRRGFEVVA